MQEMTDETEARVNLARKIKCEIYDGCKIVDNDIWKISFECNCIALEKKKCCECCLQK